MSHLIADHVDYLHSESKDRISSLLTNGHRAGGTSMNIQPAQTRSDEPKIPAPRLFVSLEPQQTTSTDPLLEMPTVGECAVHLELLEIFFSLRTKIINSKKLDETFGVQENPKIVYRKEYDYKTRKYNHNKYKIKDTSFKARRREKWVYYLHCAVGRFMTWAVKANKDMAGEKAGERLPYLPPLDVLMVWHAFLLNPEDYKQACKSRNLDSLYKVPFPWKEIHAAINMRTLTYTLPKRSRDYAEGSGMAPDLYAFLISKEITGPIGTGLKVYGTLADSQTWDKRPSLGKIVRGEPHMPLQRGFVASFNEATTMKNYGKPLVANVQRQAAFVDKMHRHLWIRSPAVEGTIRRAIERYGMFLGLFKLYPKRTLVPTLDVDLAWHTHQLSPVWYVTGTRKRAGRFIDHDDKIVQGKLDVGYDRTKELFQVEFGHTYAVCLCWDCEAMASVMEQADDLYDADDADVEKWADQAKLDVEYHRLVEMARRKGGRELLPVLKDTTR